MLYRIVALFKLSRMKVSFNLLGQFLREKSISIFIYLFIYALLRSASVL